MRLHTLTLRDVKGVKDRTIELPEVGVVVIEGPNEIGKSTMLEAFDALLTLKSTSKAAAARALQPVDRDVAPCVAAEFSIGGLRLRYAKRWLKSPSTTLQILGERPEQLTGDAAQQRVDALVSQHLDTTLWDALRLTQSGDGTVAPLVSSSVLTAALDAAAGSQQHADGADVLLDKVSQEYSTYFTATGRPTGDYRLAMSRHSEAEQGVAEAHRRLTEGMALLERQEQLRASSEAASEQVDRADREVSRAQEASAQAELVATRHAEAQERLASARAQHASALQALQERERLITELATWVSRAEQAREESLAATAAADELAEALTSAEQTHGRTSEALEVAADRLDQVRQDADDRAELDRLEGLVSGIDHIRELVEKVARAREALPQVRVEREVPRRVRALQDRLDAMVLQHAAASPSLEIESLGAEVVIDLADGQGHEVVAPGERQRLSVAHDTTVDVPGGARIRVYLHEEALGRVAELGRLRRSLADSLAEHGVEHVDELDRLAETTEQAAQVLRESVRDVEVALRSRGEAVVGQARWGKMPDALVAEVAQARERIDSLHAARDADHPLPMDAMVARGAVEAATAAHRTARAAHREATERVSERRAQVAALTSRLDLAGKEIVASEARADALQQQLSVARQSLTDEALQPLVDECAAQVTVAGSALEKASEAVRAADVDGVRRALVLARDRSTAAVRARELAMAELHHVSGQVEMAAGEGRQELYDLAVTDLQDAERHLRAIDRRARAARHLFTTLNQHRDAAHRAYVRPYTDALESLGRRVYGDGFGVTVDEELALTARTLDGATVPFSELSGGAKEQLGILARLAVARLVDPDHGVPVVIDDALGYSDPERLRQMGAVLGHSPSADAHGPSPAGDVQVILLTCTPDRYAAIPHVATIRLTA
ncbi:AAA family ATPase [Ornithinimicrobium sp. Y1847]|uniref:AAA family ATPase n=1 Tax=Ornithinimicrobium sp. Y1847 TaxID=3405419 RepID=UPI003B67433B